MARYLRFTVYGKDGASPTCIWLRTVCIYDNHRTRAAPSERLWENRMHRVIVCYPRCGSTQLLEFEGAAVAEAAMDSRKSLSLASRSRYAIHSPTCSFNLLDLGRLRNLRVREIHFWVLLLELF